MAAARFAAGRLLVAALVAVPILGAPAAEASTRPAVAASATQDGVGTLLLAFAVGLLGLLVILLLLAVRSKDGRHSLAAMRVIALVALDWARERRVPDERRQVPAAEIRRRRVDALQDLRSGFGDEPTAMGLAWDRAILEDIARQDLRNRERVRQERQDRQAHAAARVAASMRRAQERAAVERAEREAVELAAPEPDKFSEWEKSRLAEVAAAVSARVLAAERSVAEAEAAAARAVAQQAEAERAAARAAEMRAAQDRERVVEEIALEQPAAGRAGRTVDLRAPVHAVPEAAPRSKASHPADVLPLAPPTPAVLPLAPPTPAVTRSIPEGPVTLHLVPPPTPTIARPPVSAHMAWGAPLVRHTAAAHRRNTAVVAVRTRLLELREETLADAGATNLVANLARWCLLAVVPLTLVARTVASPGWVDRVAGASGGRLGLVAIVALTGLGSIGVWRATTPPFALRRSPVDAAEPQLMVPLAVAEQMALRLVAGMSTRLAWRGVASLGGLPAGSEPPTTTVDQAVAVVARLRQILTDQDDAKRRRVAMFAVVPFLACLAPAGVLVLVL